MRGHLLENHPLDRRLARSVQANGQRDGNYRDGQKANQGKTAGRHTKYIQVAGYGGRRTQRGCVGRLKTRSRGSTMAYVGGTAFRRHMWHLFGPMRRILGFTSGSRSSSTCASTSTSYSPAAAESWDQGTSKWKHAEGGERWQLMCYSIAGIPHIPFQRETLHAQVEFDTYQARCLGATK